MTPHNPLNDSDGYNTSNSDNESLLEDQKSVNGKPSATSYNAVRGAQSNDNDPFIKSNQLVKEKTSVWDRALYAVLTGLFYGFGGLTIDLTIALVRSLFGNGSGSISWLFAPVLLIIGSVVGFLDGRNSGADTMDALQVTENPHLDDASIRHDVFRGIGVGIFIFAIFWLILTIIS